MRGQLLLRAGRLIGVPHSLDTVGTEDGRQPRSSVNLHRRGRAQPLLEWRTRAHLGVGHQECHAAAEIRQVERIAYCIVDRAVDDDVAIDEEAAVTRRAVDHAATTKLLLIRQPEPGVVRAASQDHEAAREPSAIAAGHPATAREELDAAYFCLLERDAAGSGLVDHPPGQIGARDTIRILGIVGDPTRVLEVAPEQLLLEHQRSVACATEAATCRQPGWAAANDDNVVLERHQ